MTKRIFLLILLLGTTAFATRIEYNYKVTRLSTKEVGISCLNGGDPTGTKLGETLIISCGK